MPAKWSDPENLKSEQIVKLYENGLGLTPITVEVMLEIPLVQALFIERKAGAILFSCSNLVLLTAKIFNGHEIRVNNHPAIKVKPGFQRVVELNLFTILGNNERLLRSIQL